MFKNTKITFTLLLLAVSLLFAQSNSVKLTGEIVSFTENNKTQVSVVVYVDSLDELDSYLIVNNGKGAELKSKNGKHIEFTGTIKTDENEVNWITISSYKFIQVQDPEEEDINFTESDTLDEAAVKNQWDDY